MTCFIQRQETEFEIENFFFCNTSPCLLLDRMQVFGYSSDLTKHSSCVLINNINTLWVNRQYLWKKDVTEEGDLLFLYPKWEENFMLNFPSLCNGEPGITGNWASPGTLQTKCAPAENQLSAEQTISWHKWVQLWFWVLGNAVIELNNKIAVTWITWSESCSLSKELWCRPSNKDFS